MQTLASNIGGNEMNKLKEKFGFEFWQKFGKALMVVIAVMPAAGLMISLGKTVAMINPNVAPLVIRQRKSICSLSSVFPEETDNTALPGIRLCRAQRDKAGLEAALQRKSCSVPEVSQYLLRLH